MTRWTLVALSAVVLLAPESAAAQAGTPFHVSGTIHGEGMPDLACRGFYYSHTGSMDSSLGPLGWTGDECVDAIAQPGAFTITGTFSLDNGLLTGRFEATGSPETTGQVSESGTFAITGGSGAYCGASGGGTITIVAQPTASTADVELTGSLSHRR